ncbi:hypothetical protein NFI96_025655 [Prochilodus magdalenae]|nr:hypothetical protein NFI96_025655 [Prochilodus magdalenae]
MFSAQRHGQGMDGTQMSSMSQWLNSDVFIMFVVVLVLLVVAAFAVCWVMRCRRARTGATTDASNQLMPRFPPLRRMAEIEIIPADGPDRNNQSRFILKIVTEQRHASELVRMLTSHGHLTEDPACPTDRLTPEVTENTVPTDQPITSQDLPTTSPIMACVTAVTEPLNPESVVTDDDGVNNIADEDDSDDDPSRYSSPVSSGIFYGELNDVNRENES